ncbi:subtilisin-like protein [Penicillium hispanicum]|uniref:subtilisin-like protein n=1 Tax=Penicillium hispanicum TaxID=1080232 RepID=UPI00253F9418|nr:subtilisin-like protein [Penicillium hispanicum]KAJ5595502.1 subtilisin-like protein [Penicillium hispanicum]
MRFKLCICLLNLLGVSVGLYIDTQVHSSSRKLQEGNGRFSEKAQPESLTDKILTFPGGGHDSSLPESHQNAIEASHYADSEITSSTLNKRLTQIWLNQEPAGHELVVISTPNDQQWSCRVTYNYAEEAGEGIFIYHIEVEFDGRLETPLTTPGYRSMPAKYRDGPNQHTTGVASKAIGKTYGVAKKARLISVNIAKEKPNEMKSGFQVVVDNINEDKKSDNPTRYKNSIVVMSLGFDNEAWTVNPTEDPWKSIESSIDELFDLGVPVVLASGNHNKYFDKTYEVVDYPQTLLSKDFPIINVGCATSDGELLDVSQEGSKVTIYADGHLVTCAGFSTPQTGSSYTAPQVAGGIAVFMSQKQGPFYDKTKDIRGTRAFVFEVRNFLLKEASRFVSSTNMFYNLNPV